MAGVFKVNLAEKLAQFDSHWDPHVVVDYNGNHIMVVKFQGDFPFHHHAASAATKPRI